MKWKQLFEDLNLFLFYQPNINLKTAKQILSIFEKNTSNKNKEKYDIQFKQLQQVKQKQLSIINYDINILRKNLEKITKGDTTK